LILLMTKNRKYKKRCRKYPSYTWDGFDRWQHKGHLTVC
jgi:hypothetical protein